MRQRRALLAAALAALAALLGGGPSGAAPAEEPPSLTLAIFAPNAPFADAAQRFAYAQRLAEHLSRRAGVRATARAFVRAADLEAAQRKGLVDLAIVDAVYLASRGAAFRPLAIALVGGRTEQSWQLYASPKLVVTAPAQLAGRRLAHAATGGPRDLAFLDHALLDGVVQVGRFFGRREAAPDVASAVTTVLLGKADAVFAPEGLARGLRPVGETLGRVPLPAFCAARADLPTPIVTAVLAGLLSFGGGGAPPASIQGWRASGPAPFEELARRMQPRPKRPLMADPEPLRLEAEEVLAPAAFEPGLPDLNRFFVSPAEK